MKTNQKQKNIPEGWKHEYVKNIFSVKSGAGFKASEYVDKGIPLVQIENVGHGEIKWTNPIYLPENYLLEYPDLHLKEGDIVLALNRPVTRNKLKIAQIKKSDAPAILYQRVGKIIPKPETVNTQYLYQISKRFLKKFVLEQSIGSDQPYIAMSDLYRYKFILPPLPEQNRIVTVLETWDFGIEKLKRKVAIKKEIKKGLMQELLTGKKRLPGFSDEWKEVRLGDICTINMGQSPESENYNEKDQGLVLIQGNADLKNSRTITRIYTTQITKTADCGDLIFTVRAPVGAVGYVVQDKVCIGRGVCAIKAKNSYLDFIFYKLKHNTNDFLRYEQGSTFSAVNGKDIKGFKMRAPEINEQKAIAEILTAADNEITILEKKLTLWQDQKKYLLNNLVTGQIRTPENLLETVR